MRCPSSRPPNTGRKDSERSKRPLMCGAWSAESGCGRLLGGLVCLVVASCGGAGEASDCEVLGHARRALLSVAIMQETHFATTGSHFHSGSAAVCEPEEAAWVSLAGSGSRGAMTGSRSHKGGAAHGPAIRLPGLLAGDPVDLEILVLGWTSGIACTPPKRVIRDPNARWWYAAARTQWTPSGARWLFLLTSENPDEMRVGLEARDGTPAGPAAPWW
jgi:hypothetical protein